MRLSQTPVIVGVGVARDRTDDPRDAAEAYALMVRAVRAAASDAGSDALLGEIESITVPQGMWQYRNPGKLVADALGFPAAKSTIADLGVLQLTLLDDLCRAIAAGERSVGVVTAGEAQYRELRAMLTGQPVAETQQPETTPAPDVHLTSADPFCSDLENQRGLNVPVEYFAIIESALRHARGLGIEEHRDRLARLYAECSAIAATNPRAWRREPMTAADLRDPSPRNAMLAFPYTKRHCSDWNVNQAVAILVCSADKARALGLDEAGWVYPLSAAESRHVVVLAQQRQLGSRPGSIACGERALALAGATVADVTAADLYSCFPSALQSFARDLGLEGRCPLTVTGAMPFAGGPFNSYSLEAVARMVEVLRVSPPDGGRRPIGLVSNLSGIFGKQAVALFSPVPNERGFGFDDVTAAVAERDRPVPLVADYAGPATVAGYTVVFQAGTPSHAIAICDTPGGARTVARAEDRALLDAMMRDEFCGRTVAVTADGRFSVS